MRTPERETLRARASRIGRWIGTAVDVDALRKDPRYGPAIAAEFDTITPENAMKWGVIHPAPDAWNFGPADAVMAFAADHGLRVRGHTLVYHQQLPDGLDDHLATAELRAAVRAHIRGVVTRYRGRVSAWDVVNEAVDGDGALRDTVFLRRLGDSYIAEAFACARDADPSALLFYNDFGAEGLGPKSDGVYELVCGLRRAGVPIDGVGLQMHVGANDHPAVEEIVANLDRLAAAGLRTAVTEMDVSVRGVSGEALEAQRRAYEEIVRACAHRRGCHSVSFWGFTDRYTWLPGEAPLLLDAEYRAKPAYFGARDALSP